MLSSAVFQVVGSCFLKLICYSSQLNLQLISPKFQTKLVVVFVEL